MIYRRFENQPMQQTVQNHQVQQPIHRQTHQQIKPQNQNQLQTKPAEKEPQNRQPAAAQYQHTHNHSSGKRKVYRYRDKKQNNPRHCEKKPANILEKFLPENVYNTDTKKFFGLFTAEDLLLASLIFILADSDREDSKLLCLAILYLLVSDYLDLSSFFSD